MEADFPLSFRFLVWLKGTHYRVSAKQERRHFSKTCRLNQVREYGFIRILLKPPSSFLSSECDCMSGEIADAGGIGVAPLPVCGKAERVLRDETGKRTFRLAYDFAIAAGSQTPRTACRPHYKRETSALHCATVATFAARSSSHVEKVTASSFWLIFARVGISTTCRYALLERNPIGLTATLAGFYSLSAKILGTSGQSLFTRQDHLSWGASKAFYRRTLHFQMQLRPLRPSLNQTNPSYSRHGRDSAAGVA